MDESNQSDDDSDIDNESDDETMDFEDDSDDDEEGEGLKCKFLFYYSIFIGFIIYDYAYLNKPITPNLFILNFILFFWIINKVWELMKLLNSLFLL